MLLPHILTFLKRWVPRDCAIPSGRSFSTGNQAGKHQELIVGEIIHGWLSAASCSDQGEALRTWVWNGCRWED